MVTIIKNTVLTIIKAQYGFTDKKDGQEDKVI